LRNTGLDLKYPVAYEFLLTWQNFTV